MREQNIKQKPFTGFAGYGGGLTQSSGSSGSLSPWRIDPHHRVEDRDQLQILHLMLLPIQILLYQVVMLVLELGAMEEIGNGNPINSYGRGYFVDGWIFMAKGQTYHLYKDGRYAAVFYGSNATSAPVCIMLGSQGGFAGTGPNPGGGGNAGLPGGTNGQSTGSSGGNCGYTYGYLSGSGGAGGPAGGSPGLPQSGLTGSPGGLFYAGNGGSAPIMDGAGGNGGFGYYGGGGGGGGWQYGPGPQGSGGGGGSCYLGGLPPAAPYPVPVTMAMHGPTTGGSRIEFVSFVPA